MLIEKYITRNVAVYLILAALLLTVVLFSQQLTRFADILLSAKPAAGLMARLTLGVILNVAALALPIATLTGILIGFSQMQADSELTAMQAAGVGNLRLLAPVLVLGAAISVLALYINLDLGPRAAVSLRTAGLTAALNKLDSPVEPRVFATEIPNYVVYVRKGDVEQGKWQQVFIYTQKSDGTKQIVTARSGGIDTAAEQSELVLTDAVMTSLPADGDTVNNNGFVTEHLDRFRLVLDTGRKALVNRLRTDEPELDQLDWQELRERIGSADPKQSREAAMLFHRRLAISAAPFVFALLGTAIGLRLRRGGRGRGGIVALLVVASYYLLTIFFEQMARTGKLAPAVGAWIPPALCLVVGLGFLSIRSIRSWGRRPSAAAPPVPAPSPGVDRAVAVKSRRIRYASYLTAFPAILDRYLWKQLLATAAFACVALCLVFVIFTVFEMWRFVATTPGGWSMLGRYLFFLIPFVVVQVLPLSTLVSSITVYALLAKRSEAVAWLVGGQSLYRLIIPGLIVAIGVGFALWRVQEDLMPAANLRQDTLRAQLRGRIIQTPQPFGARWAASADSNTLFSFENASTEGAVRGLTIYEFDAEGVHLSRIVMANEGASSESELKLDGIRSATFSGGQVRLQHADHLTVSQADAPQIFKQSLARATYVNASALSAYIRLAEARGEEVRDLQLELYRKYATPTVPIVMALMGMPLALLVGRRSVVTAASLSIAIGLAFWGLLGLTKQLSTYGFLSPKIAAWAPVALFFAVGIYLISRLRS